jgi:carbonic anhydrase
MKRLVAKKTYTPDEAKQILIEGNQRFVSNKLQKKDFSIKRREELYEHGQNPFAIIVTCSDSRVPPEIIFDQGLGDLFVIRVAGNVMDEVTMGSVEYAVEELDCPLVIVMGHEKCGAVKDAMESDKADEDIQIIVDKIKPSIKKLKDKIPENQMYEAVITQNIRESVRELKQSKVLSSHTGSSSLDILAAKYYLETGKVEFISIY